MHILPQCLGGPAKYFNSALLFPSQTFPAFPLRAAPCMQWEVPLNKPPWFTQLLEISFKGSALASE